jgi:hypothetical protein
MTTWFTAQQAADHVNAVRAQLSEGYAGCSERTIRSYVARGHLAAQGRDARGRQLFTIAAVARAELATRARALRLVGIGQPSPKQEGTPSCPTTNTPTSALPPTSPTACRSVA